MYHERPMLSLSEIATIDYPSDAPNHCVTCAIPSRVVLPQSTAPYIPNNNVDGVADHSSDERYFIVAIDRQSKLGKQAFEYWMEMNNIGFKSLLGKFRGTVEYSYIINARNWIKVRNSGFVSRQQYLVYLWPHSVGYVHYGVEQRMATLYNLANGDTTPMGVLVPINDNELDQYEDWSYDYSQNRYYVTKTKEQLNV